MKLSADQVDGQLKLNWEQPLALDGDFISYDVYVWPANTEAPATPTQSISTLGTLATSFTMSSTTQDPEPDLVAAMFSSFSQSMSIAEAGSYNLKVVTITSNNSLALTDVNVATGTQMGLAVPARPRNEILEADSQQLRVVWSEPTSDGGAPVTHYMIRKAGEDAPPCEAVQHDSAALSGEIDESWSYSLNDVSALIYQQAGLTAGSNYEIAVFACNEIGASTPAILTHSIPAPPAPPAPIVPVVPEPETEPETETPSGQGKEDEDKKPSKNPTPKPSPSPSELLNPEVGGTDDSGSDVSQELPGAPETEEQDSAEAEGETQEETLTGSGQRPGSENNPQPLLLWGLLLLLIVALRVSQKIQNRSKA
jgi:hypothetical protein